MHYPKIGVVVSRRSLWFIGIALWSTELLKQSHAWIFGESPSYGPYQNKHTRERFPVFHLTKRTVSPIVLLAVNDEEKVVPDGDEGATPTAGYTGNNLVRYRGRVAYDGSYYSGFQIQQGRKGTRTIQGTLEDVLQARFDRGPDLLRVVGAGRTDAGVSARGQAFHFDLTTQEHESLQGLKQGKPQPPLEYAMNRMLSDDIRVWNVQPAPFVHPPASANNNNNNNNATAKYAWNAIHGSTHKLYSYRICTGPVMDPVHRFLRWHIPGDGMPVNTTLLEQCLRSFEGDHDFRPFAGAVEQAEKKANRSINSVRTIYKCELIDESERFGWEGYYRIDILLSGALYKMVRNMVGTAVDVSRGKVDESTFSKLLQNGMNGNPQLVRKDNRSKPAPPEGLCLEKVFYDDEDDF